MTQLAPQLSVFPETGYYNKLMLASDFLPPVSAFQVLGLQASTTMLLDSFHSCFVRLLVPVVFPAGCPVPHLVSSAAAWDALVIHCVVLLLPLALLPATQILL